MTETTPATTREAILIFHFADRMKSELLLASGLLATVMQMQGGEREGGKRLLLDYFRSLEREVALGQTLIKDQEMTRVRTVMTGLIGMVDAAMFADIQNHLTWVISTMTTYAQRAMQFLLDKKLL
ncbi:MAG: hypothetical protein AB1491_02740 [Thermodesulfobacteriota bacterium]